MEYWIINGEAKLACGSTCHVGIVAKHLASMIIPKIRESELSSIVPYLDCDDLDFPMIREALNELSYEISEDDSFNIYDYMIEKFSLSKEAVEIFFKGSGDILINWALSNQWIRTHENNIQMGMITEEALRSLAFGLYNAFGIGCISDKYNIECGDKWYTDVPYSAIDDGIPSKLNKYRS